MKVLNKKLLLVVAPKDVTFSKQQLEKNAVLFDGYMLKSFTDDIIPLLNSVTKTEWVEVSSDYISDWVNRNNFNYWFKALGE